MSRRTVLVVMVAVAVLATGTVADTASGGGDHHSGKIPINWKVSGTFIYVQFVSPDPPSSPVGILIDGVGRGASGEAVIKVVGIPGIMIIPSPTTPHCDIYPEIPYVHSDAIFTFGDQSMLFATLDEGYACLGPLPAVFKLDIIGGTGKYMNVTGGSTTGTFVAQPVGSSGILWAETGTIVGWIDR
jgi:hypothetical protein